MGDRECSIPFLWKYASPQLQNSQTHQVDQNSVQLETSHLV